jgi:hypothetical protein
MRAVLGLILCVVTDGVVLFVIMTRVFYRFVRWIHGYTMHAHGWERSLGAKVEGQPSEWWAEL